MAKNFEKLIFGGLHEKHAVQRGIWVPTQPERCTESSLIRHGPQRKDTSMHIFFAAGTCLHSHNLEHER
jgi:hypothetical protein